MPHLKLLQSGVAQDGAARGVPTKQHLLITVRLLCSMLNVWMTLDRDQVFDHTLQLQFAYLDFSGKGRSRFLPILRVTVNNISTRAMWW